MTSELRWILLIIGVVFIAALSVWERRRPRHASASSATERPSARDLSGESVQRARQEPKLTLPDLTPAAHGAAPLPVIEFDEEPETDEVPVLEATHDDDLAALRPGNPLPAGMDEDEDFPPEEVTAPEASQPAARWPEPAAPQGAARLAEDAFDYVPKIEPAAPAPPAREELPELPPAAPLLVEWPPDDERRIVALRLVAPQPQRFAGRSLRQALCAEGFVLGRFAIFHKPDEERRAVLSAASLNRPGTFDADTMDTQHYGGLSLFAVLPGPMPPPQAFDELVFAARSLNERLHGVLQDEQGGPLTPARIAILRERLQSGAAP
jgi:cell division protein ZipA